MRTVATQTQYLTNEKILAKVTDGILDGDLITSLFISNGRAWQGGRNMRKNLKYQKISNMGWYTGMGNFATTQEDVTVMMEWTPASMYASVTLPYFELSVNRNLPAINQERLAMESAGQDMLDTIGTAFYSDGTSNQCDGLANIVDDGSVAATYAGLTRSSYDALDADISTSVGSINLDTLGASVDGATVGSKRPDLIITTQTLWRALEDLLFPSVTGNYTAVSGSRVEVNRIGMARPGQSLKGLAGYGAITYRGIPVVWDAKCTSGYIYYLNREYTYWSGLPHVEHGTVNLGGGIIEGVDNMKPRNHGIAWTGWKEPINQDGKTGQFILYGQMICESPRHNACDQGCTA